MSNMEQLLKQLKMSPAIQDDLDFNQIIRLAENIICQLPNPLKGMGLQFKE